MLVYKLGADRRGATRPSRESSANFVSLRERCAEQWRDWRASLPRSCVFLARPAWERVRARTANALAKVADREAPSRFTTSCCKLRAARVYHASRALVFIDNASVSVPFERGACHRSIINQQRLNHIQNKPRASSLYTASEILEKDQKEQGFRIEIAIAARCLERECVRFVRARAAAKRKRNNR